MCLIFETEGWGEKFATEPSRGTSPPPPRDVVHEQSLMPIFVPTPDLHGPIFSVRPKKNLTDKLLLTLIFSLRNIIGNIFPRITFVAGYCMSLKLINNSFACKSNMAAGGSSSPVAGNVSLLTSSVPVCARGGYDADFVSPISEDYLCPICQLAFKDPVQTRDCGHRFCESCLEPIMR